MNKYILNKAIILVMASFFALNVEAQNKALGSWSIVNVEVNFNKKLNGFFEAQARSNEFYNKFFYHEMKAGIGYNLAPKTSLLIGGGQYVTYAGDGNFKSPLQQHETRLWEQLTLTNDIGRFKLEHRYRVEQRFINTGYRNRFRYRLNLVLPINKEKVEAGALYATAFEELFFTNNEPYFERSRAMVGLGYALNSHFTIQSGFLTQTDFRKDNSLTTKNFMQLSLLFDIDRGKTDRPRYPNSMD